MRHFLRGAAFRSAAVGVAEGFDAGGGGGGGWEGEERKCEWSAWKWVRREA